jgi:hypothetical protein
VVQVGPALGQELFGGKAKAPLVHCISPGNPERIEQKLVRGGLHVSVPIGILKQGQTEGVSSREAAATLVRINSGERADLRAGPIEYGKVLKGIRGQELEQRVRQGQASFGILHQENLVVGQRMGGERKFDCGGEVTSRDTRD